MAVRSFLAGTALLVAASGGCSSSDKPPAAVDEAVRSIEVTVGTGDEALPGTLELPPGDGPFPAIVLVAGSGPSDRDETAGPNKPFADLAAGLADQGIASLRYDKRTLVYSTRIASQLATFTATDEYVPDALAALTLLRSRAEIDPARLFVLGHSQGGTFAPLIAQTDAGVTGIVLWAAANQPFGATLVRQATYLAELQSRSGPQVTAQLDELKGQAALIDDPELPLDTPPSLLPGGLGPPYWRSLTSYDPVRTAAALNLPILIQQGARDYQVTVADDLATWRSGLAGTSTVTIKEYTKANHLFIDGEGQPTPAEYETPGHIDAQVVADLAHWVLDQPPR